MQKFIDLKTGNEFVPRASCVLCLGTFDGVHIGHRALIDEALKQKAQLSKEYPDVLGGAWCFSQPPADFLFSTPTMHITDLDEKLALFADAGLDIAVVGNFSELCNLEKDVFVQNVLRDEAHCIRSVCGFNFRFGKGRKGTPEDLEALPLGNITLDAVTLDGQPVSSSMIRTLIADGNVTNASKLLGRPYSLSLPVTHGKTLGRKLGAPTANQNIPAGTLIPRRGVYVTRATVNSVSYPAITNIGVNPTVDAGEITKAETHILGFAGDIYGDRVKIEFLDFIRPEKKFSSKDELSRAIAEDITKAKKYFNI